MWVGTYKRDHLGIGFSASKWEKSVLHFRANRDLFIPPVMLVMLNCDETAFSCFSYYEGFTLEFNWRHLRQLPTYASTYVHLDCVLIVYTNDLFHYISIFEIIVIPLLCSTHCIVE